MFDLGFAELLTFGIIALIVLGPEKLPQAMRTLGTYYAKFRRTVSTIQAEMESELDLVETRQKMQQELAKIKQAELDMQNQMAQMRQNMRKFEQSQNQQLTDTTPLHTLATDVESQNNTTDKLDTNTTFHAKPNHPTISPAEGYVEDDISNSDLEQRLIEAQLRNTKPWESMWFRLGAYDKARRLPAAPLLPNYKADELLHTPAPLANQSIKKV